MRIGIIGLQHESNTFIPRPTTLDHFRQGALLTGEAVRDAYGASRHEVGGFLTTLAAENIEAVPLFLAIAVPGGAVTADALDTMLGMIADQLDAAGELDGLLVAPHGAGVGEAHPDLDGHWLAWLRDRVDNDVPLLCTLDPHANVSPRMVEACNATVSYRTNPHIDQEATGKEAARLLVRTLRGEINPVQALARPPVQISIDRQESGALPCRALYHRANQILQRPGVLSTSINLGFPYADVPELGTSFIVVTDDDPALAESCADELGDWLVEHRQDFAPRLTSVEDAVAEAAASEDSVCLLDMGDNIGGGSPGDATFLAHALCNAAVDSSLVCLCDPEAASAARNAGAGATVTLRMGGKTDDRHGPPLEAEVEVLGLHPGRFDVAEVRHGGRPGYDMGPTAVVRTRTDLTIILFSIRIPPFSESQITHCDLDPDEFRVLTAKGVNAPIAAYENFCDRFIRVNTEGSTCADMTTFTFHHRRRPLFPFEDGP